MALTDDIIAGMARVMSGQGEAESDALFDPPNALDLGLSPGGLGMASLTGEEPGKKPRRPTLKGKEPKTPTGEVQDVKNVPFEVFPVPGGTFTNDWGAPRVGHTHQGNDIFAQTGTPIYAMTDGRAEYESGNGTCGGTVRLFGDNGVYFLGCHAIKGGKTGKVKAGDIIGYVGGTGNASPDNPHLHFEVHLDGQSGAATNPFNYLSALDPGARVSASEAPGLQPGEQRSTKPKDLMTGERERPERPVLRDPIEQLQSVDKPTSQAVLPSAMASLFAETKTPEREAPGTPAGTSAPKGLDGIERQLFQGFMDAGAPRLAKMVGTADFRTWLDGEGTYDPVAKKYSPFSVSGPINPSGSGDSARNGGLFQFHFGSHDFAMQAYKNGAFTLTPYEQAKAIVENFELTERDINEYARQVRAGTYGGWS